MFQKFRNIEFLVVTIFIVNLLLFFSFTLTQHFPSPLMYIHIVSLLFLWGFFFKQIHLLDLIKTNWKEVLLILSLVFVAFFVRIDRLEEISPGMYPDEIGVAEWGLRLYEGSDLPPFISDGYYHPTPLLYLTAFSVDTLGQTMTAIRMPNIIIGALSVGVLYVLLRLFFPVSIALFGAILLIFQYTHLVISRFSYEPVPSLFLQILTLIFLALYWKKKNVIYLLGIALSLSAGMYTYLNFRPFALFIFLITLFMLLKGNWKQSFRKVSIFLCTLFIAAMPLFSYFTIDPQGFSGRISDISIFSHNYPPSEFTKELGGNIFRITILPFYQLPITDPKGPPTSGDPNPRHNPATTSMFDIGTVLMGIFGLAFLFLKHRKLFWIVLILFIPPILSDVFAHERIPEFHYPGIGHPHAMRVSGFILTTVFAATAGLYWIYLRWSKEKVAEILTLIGIFVLGVSFWNWHLYFNQIQVSPGAYLFNYKNNFTQASKTASYLNTLPGQKLSVTKDLADTINFQFFIDPNKKLNTFELTSTESAKLAIQESDTTAIGVTQQTIPVLNALNGNELASMGYTVNTLNNPLGQPGVIIISKYNNLNIRPINGL